MVALKIFYEECNFVSQSPKGGERPDAHTKEALRHSALNMFLLTTALRDPFDQSTHLHLAAVHHKILTGCSSSIFSTL